MRSQIDAMLKEAIKARDSRKTSTLRLINAAIKDRDIETRQNRSGGISDDDILELLAKMIKQRRESQKIYEEAGRLELAQQEQEEIEIINIFMPEQMSDEEINDACRQTIKNIQATGLKDMGKTMGALKKEYSGRMDFGKASKFVKEILG